MLQWESNNPITAEVLADLPSLELVVTSTTGVNHIDMAECCRRGIRVTNTGDLFSDDVADGAVGLLIDVMRRISAGDRFVRGGLWPMTEVYTLGSKLGGKKVGIVGLGNIGSRVATRRGHGLHNLIHLKATKILPPLHFLPKCPPTRFQF
ncbi:glyoxylate/hydroxypyruvate reductase HPR3-like protein [Tanacetum coccineum]